MNILILASPEGAPGGYISYTDYLIAGLLKMGHNVSATLPKRSIYYSNENIVLISQNDIYSPNSYFNKNYNLIILNDLGMYICHIAFNEHDLKYLKYPKEHIYEFNREFSIASENANKIITVSQYQYDLLKSTYPNYAYKFEKIYNGIDIEFIENFQNKNMIIKKNDLVIDPYNVSITGLQYPVVEKTGAL